MESYSTQNPVTGVPKKVAEEFIAALEKKGISAEVIARLKDTLLKQGDLTEEALKKALFNVQNT